MLEMAINVTYSIIYILFHRWIRTATKKPNEILISKLRIIYQETC